MKTRAAWILTLIFSPQLFAQSLEFGRPGLGGSGCKSESTTITMREDRQQLHILFNDYLAHSSFGEGPAIDRKACSLAIPVRVPYGYSVALLPVELNGFAAISEGGQGEVQIETFFAGQQGRHEVHPLRSGEIDYFTVYSSPLLQREIWSACGQDTILRINTSVLSKANAEGARSLILVQNAATFELQWKRCP
ncbi:MAG: DUF4360 domain-containing protein [Bdellovibrionales bacterium]